MATLSSIRSPGVYIQELPAGSRPIEGVGTAIAAFVGITADGPYDQAIKVANWGQYTRDVRRRGSRARTCRTPSTSTSTTAAARRTSRASGR